MSTTMKMTGIRLADDQSYKIRYIAAQNHRKINDELRLIINKHIAAYEAEHGEIPLPDRNPVGGGTTE